MDPKTYERERSAVDCMVNEWNAAAMKLRDRLIAERLIKAPGPIFTKA